MTDKEKIEEFETKCFPFSITDHGNSLFCLSLATGVWIGEHPPYCQKAFDKYADMCEIEEGSHGSGYEWQAAFQETFKEDPNIRRLYFDSESGSFFCYSRNLDLLLTYGFAFKSICENTDKFALLISEGVANMPMRDEEQERIYNSVRGVMMMNPQATFEIRSPLGEVRITPDIAQKLIDMELGIVVIEDCNYADWELLDQPILEKQTDIFDKNTIRLLTDEAPEIYEDFTQTM